MAGGAEEEEDDDEEDDEEDESGTTRRKDLGETTGSMTESPRGLPEMGEERKEGGDSEKSSENLRSSYSEMALSSVSREDSVSVTGGEMAEEEERDLSSCSSSGSGSTSSSCSRSSAATSAAISSARGRSPLSANGTEEDDDEEEEDDDEDEVWASAAAFAASIWLCLRASKRLKVEAGRRGTMGDSGFALEGRPARSMEAMAAATAAVLPSTLDENCSFSSCAKPGLSTRIMTRFADCDVTEAEDVELRRSCWNRAAENILLAGPFVAGDEGDDDEEEDDDDDKEEDDEEEGDDDARGV